jgi:protein-L-isoaspartate(D-aspartate) O-methyltransferase
MTRLPEMETVRAAAAGPAELRRVMVDRLRDEQVVRSAAVEDAMRAVARHVFAPDVPLEQAYGPDPVVTHRDSAGVAISSASAPGVVAGMLEELDVRPGHRVLEIGAGTGYNAALLAHMAGPAGSVTTVEYDEAVAASAGEALAQAGYGQVMVVCGDGVVGWAGNAPYDRIVVTAGAWDVPPAWRDQLAGDGVLVVPLRMRGLTRAVALDRDDAALVSRSVRVCGFIPMRGIGAVAEQNVWVGGDDGDLLLRIDDSQQADRAALAGALDHPVAVTWTGAPFAMPEILDFWLAGLDGFCRVLVSRDAAASGRVVAPLFPWGSMGVFGRGSVAYLTASSDMSELGVAAYGAAGQALADMVAGRIREWDRAGGQRMSVQVEIHPAGAPPDRAGWLVIGKRHSSVVVRMIPGA